MNPRLLPILAVFLPLASLVLPRVANDKALPPPRQALEGAWAGYESGGTYFYYLMLEASGRGKCEVLFTDGTIDSYSVDEWRLDAATLVLRISPVSAGTEAIAVSVTCCDHLSMDLTISGKDGHWERKATVFNEREFLARATKCRKRAEGVSPKKP